MKKLIPIGNIPLRAREMEILTRRAYPSREAAQADAAYCVTADPDDDRADAPVIGWVCTRAAAEAVRARLARRAATGGVR